MFAKLAVLILSLGACACGLLAMRQSRLQAASELAQVQLRISKLDQELWELRSEIATKVSPQHIERMALDVGPLGPMIPGYVALKDAIAVQGAAVAGEKTAAKQDAKPELKSGSKTEVGVGNKTAGVGAAAKSDSKVNRKPVADATGPSNPPTGPR